VRDLDRSIAWYERLGFRLLQRWEGWAMLDRGGSRIALQADAYARDHPHYFGPGFERDDARGLGVEVSVDVDDLDALYGIAQGIDGAVVKPPVDRPWGARDFRVADPDGFFVRFTTPLGPLGE